MILTNWKDEIRGIIKTEGLSWQEVADRIGATRQGAYGVVHDTKSIVQKSIVNLMEAIGYDIEINFVRRK